MPTQQSRRVRSYSTITLTTNFVPVWQQRLRTCRTTLLPTSMTSVLSVLTVSVSMPPSVSTSL